MGTDVLTTIQTNVRASLADTGSLFPDAMVNAAINEVVADISRVAPRELVHVEVLHSRTVTDESFTSSYDAWVTLSDYIDMQQEVVVTTDPAATTYTEDTDYIIDYAQGRIQVLSTGAMADATGFLIDYEKSLRSINLSSLTDFIAIDRLEISRNGGQTFQEYSSYYQWGDVLWFQAKDGTTEPSLSENDHVRVWYKAEHTKPGASAGSYPAYMDDVVTKGAVAYALFSKHRERNLQSVTDATSSRTALALADDDQTAINTLETAVTAALDSAKTALALADGLTDTPLGDAELALDAVKTALALVDGLADTPLADAENALDASLAAAGATNTTLLDAAAFTGIITSQETALDGAQTLLDASGLPNTALDKVIEHLESDTLSGGQPDSAEKQLGAGDGLINAANLGADAPALYARYADMQVRISDGFIGEANARILQARVLIEESSGRAQQKLAYLEHVAQNVAIANAHNGEADQRLGIAGVIIQAASGYIGEARERIGIAASLHEAAVGYIQEATGRMLQIDRHLALGTLYLNQARGYQEAADREHATADRFLFDAQERHSDYWEHLQSRVEMSWPNQRQASVRQNA